MDDNSDLHFAAATGDMATLERLLRQGCDLNAFDDISRTPLHYAAENGHLEIIALLLSFGADVNAHDEASIGETPLGRVAGNCSLAVAEALIAAGANPTIRGWMQLTAPDRAKDRKRNDGPEVYKLLTTAARRFTIGE